MSAANTIGNIPVETGTIAGQGASLTGDQVIAGVQEILKAEGYGISQLVMQPTEQNGSTFTYKLPERLIPELYARSTTGKSQAKGGKVGQVDITTTHEDIVAIEFEDMIFATQILAEQEKARLVASMATAIIAHLDLIFLKQLNDSTNKPEITGFSKATTETELKNARLKLGDVVAELESTLTPTEMGVATSRQIIILSPKAYLRYINSFDTNVVSQSDEIKRGNLTIRMIGGAMVIKHPLIGKNILAGQIHKTEALDMETKKIEGFAFVDVSIAMPVNFILTRPRWNENFNQEIGMKYKFGAGVLRDKLIVPLTIESKKAV